MSLGYKSQDDHSTGQWILILCKAPTTSTPNIHTMPTAVPINDSLDAHLGVLKPLKPIDPRTRKMMYRYAEARLTKDRR